MPNESAEALLSRTYNLITKNKALINSISQKSGRTLFQVMLLLQRPDIDMPLIKHMVTHPIFDPSSANKDVASLTNLQALIAYRRLDVLKIMAADPRILYIGQSLSCEYVKKQLDIACAELAQERARQMGQILIFFVRVTIINAIKNDDDTLFDQLKKAGFHPTQITIQGKLPFDHLTTKHTKLHAWFKCEQAKIYAAGANPHLFYAGAVAVAPKEQEFAKKETSTVVTLK